MKYLIIIPFLFLACTNSVNQKMAGVIHFDTGFSLYQDTIYVDIKGGDLTHALKYNDKFYVLFQQYDSYDKRWLYIFSNGEVKKIVDFPTKLDAIYLDFFVKNDSIILKPYMEKQYYYFDTHNFIWKTIEQVDDLIFEDERFYIYSLDFGEWGGLTWFKDKTTDLEYTIAVTTPLVNRIDTVYYLTTPYEVLKIENPLQLHKCSTDARYANFQKKGKEYYRSNKSVGFSVIFCDTTYPYFSPNFPYKYKPNIVTSFVWQNELLHIYETDTVTYIAKIESNLMKPIDKIGKELFFYDGYSSYRCKNLNDNNALLKFRTKDESVFGLMEIVDNKISIHYLVNTTEL